MLLIAGRNEMLRIIFAFLLVSHSWAATQYVDLTGPGCDSLDGYYLKKADDFISAFALPQYNTMATRDHCDMTVRADLGRRIEYMIESIVFNECGVEIRMYDNPTIDTNPIQIITCNYNSKVPIQGKTKYEVLRIRVRKTTPESRAFEFRIRMKNDLGPTMQFEQDAAKYTGQDLEPGVIAGICIGGGIAVIGLICAAIFLCVRARSANIKHQKYAEESSAYTTNQAGRDMSDGQKQTSLSGGQQRSSSPQRSSTLQRSSSPQMSSTLQRSEKWRPAQPQPPPYRMRPVVPMPTQPAPRDPGRKSLSDRHRSGERTARASSQDRYAHRRYETDA